MYHRNFFTTKFTLRIYFVSNFCNFIFFPDIIKNIFLFKNHLYNNYTQKKRFLILIYKIFFFLNCLTPSFLHFDLDNYDLILHKKPKNHLFYKTVKKLLSHIKYFTKKNIKRILKFISEKKLSIFNYILKFLVFFFVVYIKSIYRLYFNSFFMFIITHEHFFCTKKLVFNRFFYKMYLDVLPRGFFLQKNWKLDKYFIFFSYELFFCMNSQRKNMKVDFFILKKRKKENCIFQDIFHIQNQFNKENFTHILCFDNHASFYFKLKKYIMFHVFKSGRLPDVFDLFESFSLICILFSKTLNFFPDETEKIFFCMYILKTYKTISIFYSTYLFFYLSFLLFLKFFIFKQIIDKIKKIFFFFFFFILKNKFNFIRNYLDYFKSFNRKIELIFNKTNFFPISSLCIQSCCFIFYVFFKKKKKYFQENLYSDMFSLFKNRFQLKRYITNELNVNFKKIIYYNHRVKYQKNGIYCFFLSLNLKFLLYKISNIILDHKIYLSVQSFKILQLCYNVFFIYNKKKMIINCKFNLTETLVEITGSVCGIKKFFSFKINLLQSSIFLFFNKNSIIFKKDILFFSKLLILNQIEFSLKNKRIFFQLIQCKKIRKLKFFVLKKKFIFNLFSQLIGYPKFFCLEEKNLFSNIYNYIEKEKIHVFQCLVIKYLKHLENLIFSKLITLLKIKFDCESRGAMIQLEKLLRKKYFYYVKNIFITEI
nr:ubiquitin-protein ligase (Cullin) isoform 1 [Cryptomonas paramecium]